MSKTDDVNKKMQQLNDYVAWFEGDDFTLEEALGKYEEAKKLADSIQQDLNDLKNSIQVVKKQFDKE